MRRTPRQSDEDTDRIDPRELDEQSAEAAAFHTTAATDEHRPIGIVLTPLPRPAAEPTPASPWWKFWAR